MKYIAILLLAFSNSTFSVPLVDGTYISTKNEKKEQIFLVLKGGKATLGHYQTKDGELPTFNVIKANRHGSKLHLEQSDGHSCKLKRASITCGNNNYDLKSPVDIPEDGIYGKWVMYGSLQDLGNHTEVLLKPDHTGMIDGLPINWSLKEREIKFQLDPMYLSLDTAQNRKKLSSFRLLTSVLDDALYKHYNGKSHFMVREVQDVLIEFVVKPSKTTTEVAFTY